MRRSDALIKIRGHGRRFRRMATSGLIVLLIATGGPVLTGQAMEGGAAATPGQVAVATPIEHVIFIVKEDHSFDNMFGTFHGADGVIRGPISTGKLAPLSQTPDQLLAAIGTTAADTRQAVDGGRNDRYDLLPNAIQDGVDVAMSQYHQSDIPNYWAYAQHFTLADHIFSTILGPSFPNHLVTIAAQSDNVDANVRNAVPNTSGCDSGPAATVDTVNSQGVHYAAAPCFDIPTMATLFQQYNVSWKYYAPSYGQSGYIWSTFDAIKSVREGPLWTKHVVPTGSFIDDVRNGTLPQVSWLVADGPQSEHPPASECVGENWTVRQINALMQSPLWNSSVVFLTWDSTGGFYDHVPPPKVGHRSLGSRVPFLIISPYVRPRAIYRRQGNLSSVLRFIEERYNLGSLTNQDATANDLMDAFDFTQTPLPPLVLHLRTCTAQQTFGFTSRAPLVGTLEQVRTTPIATVLTVDSSEGIAYQVLLSASTHLTYQGGIQAQVAALSLGDRLSVTGQFDTSEVGNLYAQTVSDLSIQHIVNLQGTISYVDPTRQLLMIQMPANPAPVVVLLTSTSTIQLASGKNGAFADLARGQMVTITGSYNQNLALISYAQILRVLGSGRT